MKSFLKLFGLCVFLGCSSSHIFLVWNFYRQKMTIFAHFFQSVTCPKKCRVGWSPCVGFHFLGFYTHFISKIVVFEFWDEFLSISAKLGFYTFCHFVIFVFYASWLDPSRFQKAYSLSYDTPTSSPYKSVFYYLLFTCLSSISYVLPLS